MKKSILFVLGVALLTSCNADKTNERASELLNQATSQFEQKQYDEALQIIDSLRRTYPTAVEARKQALTLQQNIELTRTQEELAVIDEALQKSTSV